MTVSAAEGRSFVRRGLADFLMSLGVLALALGAVLSVARRALFYPDAFADRLAGSLEDPRVAAFVADRMAGAVIRRDPDLTAFRPLIVASARGAVSSSAFQALARSAARTAHASLFSAGGRTVIVSVPDVGVLMRSALANANPALADKVPPRVQGVLASLGQGGVDRTVLRLLDVSRRSQWLAGILGFGGALMALLGVVLAPSPRHGLGRLGLDLLVAGVVLLALMPAGSALVSLFPHDELARSAAAGLWDVFAGSLRTWAFVLGGIGIVLQAAGHSLIERFDPVEAAARVRSWMSNPEGGSGRRLLVGTLWLGLGGFAVLRPLAAAAALVTFLGGGLAFVGLRQLFEILPRALGEAEVDATSRSLVGRAARLRVAVVLGFTVLFAGVIAWLGWPRPARAPLVADACNGAPELCARRLDEVVFPGSHNSMSAADISDWLFPQQERGIEGQLQDGIRALLFDVHYGVPVAGRVKTDLDSETTSREKLEGAVGKEGVAAAMRIRDRLTGPAEGPRALYLCHGFCELGALPLVGVLERIHVFLVQNPNEVLLFVIEDYVSPQDLALAFAESGLDGLVYRRAPGPSWPTLREMIDARERVLVLTESGRPGIDWIHPAFEVMQETPFRFKQPSDLACTPNRGGRNGSLFLINNWIDTTPAPKPSNAAIVNAYEALLARAKACEAERGKRPTVVAVDFYRTGALFRVARALNGLADPSPP
jgi:hypothetical protein